MAVIRASEILLALIIEKVVFDARQTSNYTCFGAICVLIGVSLMSFQIQIQDKIDQLFSKKSKEMLPVKTENIDLT